MYYGEQDDSKNSKSIMLYLLLEAWDKQQHRLEFADEQLRDARNRYDEVWNTYQEISTRAKVLMEDPDINFKSIKDLEQSLTDMKYFDLIHPRDWHTTPNLNLEATSKSVDVV